MKWILMENNVLLFLKIVFLSIIVLKLNTISTATVAIIFIHKSMCIMFS